MALKHYASHIQHVGAARNPTLEVNMIEVNLRSWRCPKTDALNVVSSKSYTESRESCTVGEIVIISVKNYHEMVLND